MALCPAPALAQGVHTEEEIVRAYLASAPERQRLSTDRTRQSAAALTAPYPAHPELDLRREQSFGDTAFATTVAGLSLSLEISGRHGLNQKAAALDAEALAHRGEARRRAAVCQLRRLTRQALARQQTVELLVGGQALLQALASNLEKLVAAGERAPFDLDRLRLQLAQHGLRLAGARARSEAALAELSALTGLRIKQIKEENAAGRTAAVKAKPAGGIPAPLRALSSQARAEGLREKAAGRRWIPELGLYGGYRLDQAPGVDAGHGYEAGLTVSLPFTNRGQVERGQAAAKRASARAAATTQKASRRARLAALQARAARLRQGLDAFRLDLTLLTRSATRRYLSGEDTMSGLIDNLAALEQARLQRTDLRSRLRAAQLEFACVQGRFTNPALEKLILEVSP